MPILPISLPEVIMALFVGLIVLVPMVGLTARFALKPVVEALARMREAQGTNQSLTLIERRMALIEQEMKSLEGLREEVGRLVEEHEFQRQLATPPLANRLGAGG